MSMDQRKQGRRRLGLAILVAVLLGMAGTAAANPGYWRFEWPDTDFTTSSIDLGEIMSGGPPKDGIPSIDAPVFEAVSEMTDLTPEEPVIGLVIDGDARAYPLRILTWHEIVNDQVGGVPVAVTYCPLCNSAIVFDRRVAGEATEFGTTGKLRNSDMVMYDRATESWWQQFLGEAIVGQRTGTKLKMIPARLESWSNFRARHPGGKVLVPNNPGMRSYGLNPYAGYDSAPRPYFPVAPLPEGIPALARVVKVGTDAWTLESLQARKTIEFDDLVLTWEPGQNSALDSRKISEGRDVGNVLVQRKTDGGLEDAVYDVTFAFVFNAFHPEGTLHR